MCWAVRDLKSHETRQELALVTDDNHVADNGDCLFQGIFNRHWRYVLSICCDDQIWARQSEGERERRKKKSARKEGTEKYQWVNENLGLVCKTHYGYVPGILYISWHKFIAGRFNCATVTFTHTTLTFGPASNVQIVFLGIKKYRSTYRIYAVNK